MGLNLYQEEVKDYLLKLKENKDFKIWPKLVIITRLYDKISKISNIVLSEEGYREKWKNNENDITEEFGSALFHFIRLANLCNVDLDVSWDYIMKKYQNLLNEEH